VKRNSFRPRLSLWNSAVLALALIGCSVAIGYSLQASAASAIDEDLAANIRPLAMRPPPLPPAPPRLSRDPSDLSAPGSSEKMSGRLQRTFIIRIV
jgi:hypothetical protein